jgi:NAD(P)-dependent dehydrogenase (short-subunit alcohol dehydrogenase family)
MPSLDKRVVLITGALGNLGSATTAVFEAAGVRLVLVDRSVERLRETYGPLAANGHLLLGGVDLSDPTAVDRMVADAWAHYGRLDVLFNTVGAFRGGKPVHEDDLETWDFLFQVNLWATLLTCRATVSRMLRQGSGRIINTASPNAFAGTAGYAAYSAAKSAVVRLTESLAAEVGGGGINVNCVVPGTLDTPTNRRAMPDVDGSRWIPPAAVADVVLFLASAGARFIHGATIPVYGPQQLQRSQP